MVVSGYIHKGNIAYIEGIAFCLYFISGKIIDLFDPYTIMRMIETAGTQRPVFDNESIGAGFIYLIRRTEIRIGPELRINNRPCLSFKIIGYLGALFNALIVFQPGIALCLCILGFGIYNHLLAGQL